MTRQRLRVRIRVLDPLRLASDADDDYGITGDLGLVLEKRRQLPQLPTEALRRAVQASPLAVGLLHLPSRRFLELSQRATALLGLESVDLSGFDVLRLSKEPDATRRALDLVVDGVLDGYRARRALSAGADEIDSYLGVRTVARGGDCSRSVSVVTDPVPRRRNRRCPSDTALEGSQRGGVSCRLQGRAPR